jgi:hypothetical protein
MTKRRLLSLAAWCWMLVAWGCATGPTIRVDMDATADIKAYRTFAFFDPVSTDRSSYTTLMSNRLKAATRAQLERAGYTYSESEPDLRVNFFLKVVDKQELRSSPGSYGYRTGYYGTWAGYPYVDTVEYREGTLIIDLVDAKRKQLVWQGVAEGEVSEEAQKNPGPAVDKVVTQVFSNFPYPPKK